MLKKNTLNYEIVKSLFHLNADGEDGGCDFRVNGGDITVAAEIPTSIMHRLFRLGQA
jgi:hypothetical protein